jgi:hypothetical protein
MKITMLKWTNAANKTNPKKKSCITRPKKTLPKHLLRNIPKITGWLQVLPSKLSSKNIATVLPQEQPFTATAGSPNFARIENKKPVPETNISKLTIGLDDDKKVPNFDSDKWAKLVSFSGDNYVGEALPFIHFLQNLSTTTTSPSTDM